MKRNILLTVLMLFAAVAMAKDIKTIVFTTNPQMHCENCENKIKNNVRFVRGVKSIETSVDSQTVTIKYDADKTTPDAIRQAFDKIGYTVTEVAPATKPACAEQHSCGSEQRCSGNEQNCCGKK